MGQGVGDAGQPRPNIIDFASRKNKLAHTITPIDHSAHEPDIIPFPSPTSPNNRKH